MTLEEYAAARQYIVDRLNQTHPEALSAPVLLKYPALTPMVVELLTVGHWFNLKDPTFDDKLSQEVVDEFCNDLEESIKKIEAKHQNILKQESSSNANSQP